MNVLSDIAVESDDWLSVLTPYQRNNFEALLKTNTAEGAAQKWLISMGSPGFARFGGESNPQPSWKRFRNELRRFICDEDAYPETKERLKKIFDKKENFLLLIACEISEAIGDSLGFFGSQLTALVAIMLSVATDLGKRAFCSSAG